MADFEDIGDLYNLNDTNTKLYQQKYIHQKFHGDIVNEKTYLFL